MTNRFLPYLSQTLFLYGTLFMALGGNTASLTAEETFDLRYKLKPGQVIESEVVHLAKTDTRVNKTEQSSESRTVSLKAWEVTNIDEKGNMTFVYRINRVDMSQQIGNAEVVSYNSEKDEQVPKAYVKVAESIGKPISTITIDTRGQVVQRDETKTGSNLGMGDVALVMPAQPVKIGDEWDVPREVRVRLDDGGQKVVQVKESYTLEKVSAGVATIKIESRALTPISEPSIEAQVVQQLSNGTFKFDIDAGRMISKELKWNESVVGFSGPGSMMEYSARYNEEVKNVEAKEIKAAKKTSTKR